MHTLSAWNWVMLLVGVAMVSGAVTAMWGPRVQSAISSRRAPRANAGRTEGVDAPVRGPLGMTEPTRLSVGIVLLVWGYHLAAWALPANWLDFRVPPHLWPLVLGGGVVWAGGSLLMDARERAADRRSRSERPDRDPN